LHIKVRHEDRILRNDIRYQEVMEYALISGMDNFNPNRRIIEQDSIDENKDYIYEIEII
jgi:adenine-specific DNA-methyltransferase